MKCFFRSSQEALGCVISTQAGDSMQTDGVSSNASVVLQLFFAQQQDPIDFLPDSFYTQVASVCSIDDVATLKLIMNALNNYQEDQVSGNAFNKTSAQRIKGADYHFNIKNHHIQKVVPGENRANGQWEMLLGECLQGTSLAIDPSSSSPVPSSSASGRAATKEGDGSDMKDRISGLLLAINHWRRVLLSVVNAMVPTAALLRLGIQNGKGRSTHPLCEDRLPGSTFSSSEGSSSRFSIRTNDTVDNTISKALSFLSCVSAYSSDNSDMKLVSRSASSHLIETPSNFNDLISYWVVRMSFEAIEGVVRIAENSNESQCSSAQKVIETTLKHAFADNDDDEEIDVETGLPVITLDDDVDPEKRSTLLASLGVKNVKLGRLVGSRTDLELNLALLAKYSDINPFATANSISWGTLVTKLLLTLMRGEQTKEDASTKNKKSKKDQKAASLHLPIRARIFVSEILVDLLDAEFDLLKDTKKTALSGHNDISEIVRISAACSLDDLSKDDVLLLVDNIVYPTTAVESENSADLLAEEEKKCLSEKTARIVSYLSSAPPPKGANEGKSGSLDFILSELLARLPKWTGTSEEGHNHVIQLACLLASRFGVLDDVGRAIMSLLHDTQEGKDGMDVDDATSSSSDPQQSHHVDIAKEFFEYVALLDQLVNKIPISSTPISSSPPSKTQASSSSSTTVTLQNGEEVSRTCSFVDTGEGFTEQHWYNW